MQSLCVQESQSKLEEQQLKHQTYTAVPDEYHRGSLKGISATIKEIDQETTSSSSEHSAEGVDFNDDLDTSDVMSQLDDLEAEMMSALEDSDLEYFDDEDFPDNFPDNEDMIEVGALDLNSEVPDFVMRRDDDRRTPVSDAPLTIEEATPTHVDHTPSHVNGVADDNGVSAREKMNMAKKEQMRRKSIM